MAYRFSEAIIMPKLAIASIISAASVGALPGGLRPGRRARAEDPTLGAGDFIFLATTASILVGNIVNFRESASGAFTVINVPNTAGLANPVAVAMLTGALNNYGWFQLAGTATVKKIAVKVNPNVAVYVSATAGRITSLAASGKQILGARASPTATVASATSTVTVTINYPHMQGQTT